MPLVNKSLLFKTFICLCVCVFIIFLYDTNVRLSTTSSCGRPERTNLTPSLIKHALTVVSDTSKLRCNQTQLLFLIHSAVNNSEKRDIIRSHAYGKTVFFVVGLQDGKVSHQLRSESNSFSDIVVGNFDDTYANLTLKHLFALNYVMNRCPNVDFVVKADDDIVINFEDLESFLNIAYPPNSEPLDDRVGYKVFLGLVFKHMHVIRTPGNKWCTTPKEYPYEEFPQYCSGWAYITTIDTISTIMQQALHEDKALWIDDVYITGILREAAGGIYLDLLDRERYGFDASLMKQWVDGNECRWDKFFSDSGGSNDLMLRSYEKIHKQPEKLPACDFKRSEKVVTGRSHISEILLSRENALA